MRSIPAHHRERRRPRGPTRLAAAVLLAGVLLLWPHGVAVAADMSMEEQGRVLRGLRPAVTLQFTEADVNAYMKAHGHELGLSSGLEAPRVAFGNGSAEVSARKKLGFLVPARIRLKVRPGVREGRLVLQPIGGRAGKLLLPGAFRVRMAEALSSLMAERLNTAGFDLQRVEVRKGTLTVHGKLGPVPADAAPK